MEAPGFVRRRKRTKEKPVVYPWTVPPIGTAAGGDDADIFAIKALARGIANSAQQIRAYRFILHTICNIDRMDFDPAGDRQTSFQSGKRHVGLVIRRVEGLADATFLANGVPQTREPRDRQELPAGETEQPSTGVKDVASQ